MSKPVDIRNAVREACLAFMVPIARFLIRNGVSAREFIEIAKSAMVMVATEDYRIRGRKTNVSRVAVLTGLTRKEVARLRKDDATARKAGQRKGSVGRPEQLLHAWHYLPEYRSSHGRPNEIPFEGEAPSFIDLCRRAGGDIPPMAMRKELVRAGSIVELPTGKLRIVSENFIPDATDPEAIRFAGMAVHDLLTTINYNLFDEDKQTPLIERRVYSEQLDRRALERFRSLSTSEAERLLFQLNDWLANHETVDSAEQKPPTYRAGLGVYFFQDITR